MHAPEDPITVHVAAARAIAKGQEIADGDVVVVIGRVAAGEARPFIRPHQVIGMAAKADIAAGTPLAAGSLYRPPVKPAAAGDRAAEAPNDALAKEVAAIRALLETLAAGPPGIEQAGEGAGNGGRPPPPAPPAGPPGAGAGALRGLLGDLEAGATAGKSLFDVLDAALKTGREAIAKGQPVGLFLEAFARELGVQSADALGDGVRAVATTLYARWTAEGAPPPIPGPPVPVTQTVTLYAAVGEAESPETEGRLAALIEAAKAMPAAAGCAIAVTGHADTLGADERNRTLSEARARRVADRLRQALPPAFPVTEAAWGERRLAEWTGDGAPARANRRTEVTLSCTAPPG